MIGVGVARAAHGAALLTDLAAIATPVLAALAGVTRRWRRAWLPLLVVPPLYVIAWIWPGSLLGDAAGVALIAGACLAVTGVVAGLAPPRWTAAGLVLLVVLDCLLVWGDRQVGPATIALQSANPLSLFAHPLPSLQQAQFGSMQMGWLDLAAPALLGLIVQRRVAAFLATAVGAGLWDLLFLVTPMIAATPPVLAGLAAGRIRPPDPTTSSGRALRSGAFTEPWRAFSVGSSSRTTSAAERSVSRADASCRTDDRVAALL